MSANSQLVFLGASIFMVLSAGTAVAVQHLDAHGQSKVNKAMAKKWSQSDPGKDGYTNMLNKSVVNIGSKKSGDCVVNVGTSQAGQKAPKEIVVTTKEVINVCK